MANRIVLKKSSVAAKVPLTTDLEYGELALNYSDEKLYFKNASNAIKSFTAVDWAKRSVRVATTANITLSGTQTIDGIAVAVGDRVLVKDQTTASQNGIYVVSATTWSRAAGADTALEMAGAVVVVESGTANGGFHFNTDFKSTDTLGTTALTFSKVVDFGDVAGAATASKIPIRTSGGDINMRYGVTQYVSMSHSAAARNSDTVFYSSTDNYIRKNTAAGLKTSLSLNNVENTALSTWAGSTNLTTLGTISSGTWNGSAISDTYLSTISTAGKVSNSATTATNANTASAIVARDASGNFSAGTITAALSGNATTATTLQTARTINGTSFNGSANIVVEPYVENDDSTNATRYITFVDSTTAGYQRLNEDSNFTINPSTGTVTTNGAFASIFALNKNTIDTSYSIPSGYNATSAGPVVINNGITVTIPTGSTWVIV
jgi:hypothetical protein